MYYQKMPQSKTADQPVTPRGRDTEHAQPKDYGKAANAILCIF